MVHSLLLFGWFTFVYLVVIFDLRLVHIWTLRLLPFGWASLAFPHHIFIYITLSLPHAFYVCYLPFCLAFVTLYVTLRSVCVWAGCCCDLLLLFVCCVLFLTRTHVVVRSVLYTITLHVYLCTRSLIYVGSHGCYHVYSVWWFTRLRTHSFISRLLTFVGYVWTFALVVTSLLFFTTFVTVAFVTGWLFPSFSHLHGYLFDADSPHVAFTFTSLFHVLFCCYTGRLRLLRLPGRFFLYGYILRLVTLFTFTLRSDALQVDRFPVTFTHRLRLRLRLRCYVTFVAVAHVLRFLFTRLPVYVGLRLPLRLRLFLTIYHLYSCCSLSAVAHILRVISFAFICGRIRHTTVYINSSFTFCYVRLRWFTLVAVAYAFTLHLLPVTYHLLHRSIS